MDYEKVEKLYQVDKFIEILIRVSIDLIKQKICPFCNDDLLDENITIIANDKWTVSCLKCGNKVDSAHIYDAAALLSKSKNISMMWKIIVDDSIAKYNTLTKNDIYAHILAVCDPETRSKH